MILVIVGFDFFKCCFFEIGHSNHSLCITGVFLQFIRQSSVWPQVHQVKILKITVSKNRKCQSWCQDSLKHTSFCSYICTMWMQCSSTLTISCSHALHLPHITSCQLWYPIKWNPFLWPLWLSFMLRWTFPTALESHINLSMSSKPPRAQRRGKVTTDNLPSWRIASHHFSGRSVYWVFFFHLQHPPSALSRDLTGVFAPPVPPETHLSLHI